MRHPPIPHRRLILCLVAVLAGAWRPLLAQEAETEAGGPRAILVVDSAAPRLVDPATGVSLWSGGSWDSVALGPDGTLYLGFDRDGRTDVLAFAPGDATPVLVSDRAPDGARVRGVSATGDRLYLLSYGEDGLPAAFTALPLPAGSTVPDGQPRAYRDDGGGMLLSDGSRWYGLDASGDHPQLVEVRFQDGAPLATTPLLLEQPIGHPLLMSPDGRRIYTVCHPCQTISVVDTVARQVTHTVSTGRPRPTKGPACAAVLSPDGDRLYVVAAYQTGGDGIDVFDAATFERVAHYFPGRDFYCLAVSPDGARLYADTMDGELVTLDATTGTELTSVPIETDPAPPYLGLATATS